MVLEFFNWIPSIFGSLYNLATSDKKASGPLPDVVLENILSRLPADSVLRCRRVCKDWRALTSSSYFVELQNRRAPTFILVHCCELAKYNPKLQISVFDKNAKELKTIRLKCDDVMKKHNAMLVGSCGALLVFMSRLPVIKRYIIILNPVTQEQRFICPSSRVCGIYFHPSASEHKLLQVHHGTDCYRYTVYSFESRLTREIASGPFRFRPVLMTSPSVVNHDLHWLSDHTEIKDNDVNLCDHTIIVFKKDSEDFSTLPHPRRIKCSSIRNHELMQLFVKDEQLCLFHIRNRSGNIDIWILEDYANGRWDKRYNLTINITEDFDTSPYYLCRHMKILSFEEDELLIDWFQEALYLYHLTRKTTKRIDVPGKEKNNDAHRYNCVNYTSSLATPGFISPRSRMHSIRSFNLLES